MRYTLLLVLATLACGMSVPQAPTATPIHTMPVKVLAQERILTPVPTQEIGLVLVPLTVRSQPSAEAQSVGYLDAGTPVSGSCLTFETGDIWLELSETRFVAVRYQERIFVDGICNFVPTILVTP